MAVGGIALSLYAGMLTVDDIRDRASSERNIGAACAGLVSGSEVMELRGGTGRAFAREGVLGTDGSSYEICDVYRGTAEKNDGLFRLQVFRDDLGPATPPPATTIGRHPGPGVLLGGELDMNDDPFDSFDRIYADDVTARAVRPEPYPLGDGTLGWYDADSVTVRAECGPDRLFHVTARAAYEPLPHADRLRLAELARDAAGRVADRYHCDSKLPEVKGPLPETSVKLRPARTATGSCAFYPAHLRRNDDYRLPDRALSVPAAASAHAETCVLAPSPDKIRTIAEAMPEKDRDQTDHALGHSPWWLRTATYAGPEARTVGYRIPFLMDGGAEHIELGSAGGHDGIWWASSVCAGRPALHTLSVHPDYDRVLNSGTTESLFRAYVNDITERHDCTRVTFPKAPAFRDREQ
ncbi:hypothetical protein [Streptomyces sp. NPDC050145]|uniref:hypothetical protein n=1 Tax=Streptomyces sp. NPDC050145 TaxID=3365602 RepID=UPI0037B6BEE0